MSTIQYCKTDTLWRLYRIKNSADPGKASLDDLRNLAKGMIGTYNTSVCLENADCPINFAMQTDNMCFPSLFLSYETANANSLLERGSTPLLIESNCFITHVSVYCWSMGHA